MEWVVGVFSQIIVMLKHWMLCIPNSKSRNNTNGAVAISMKCETQWERSGTVVDRLSCRRVLVANGRRDLTCNAAGTYEPVLYIYILQSGIEMHERAASRTLFLCVSLSVSIYLSPPMAQRADGTKACWHRSRRQTINNNINKKKISNTDACRAPQKVILFAKPYLIIVRWICKDFRVTLEHVLLFVMKNTLNTTKHTAQLLWWRRWRQPAHRHHDAPTFCTTDGRLNEIRQRTFVWDLDLIIQGMLESCNV